MLGSLTQAGYITRERRKTHEQVLEKIAQEGVKAMYTLNW